VLRKEVNVAGAYIANLVVPMPTNAYVNDPFMNNIPGMWNFLMIFIFIAPVYRLIHNIVNEK